MAELNLVDRPLGAVAYLNMLPFFHGDACVRLAASPRELNMWARAGEVGAACMSAIAGIRAGFTPLMPMWGIGVRRAVGSVYIEPVLASQADAAFWQSFCARNKAGLAREREGGIGLPWRSQGIDPSVDALSPRRVRVVTSGASEHSEWLIRVLLWAQGVESSVHVVDAAVNDLAPHELSECLAPLLHEEPACLLAIGDPALERARHFPRTASERLDLGTLWNDFSGLPCIFAAWFRCGAATDAGAAAHVGAQLARSVEEWRACSDFGRAWRILAFLGTTSPAIVEAYGAHGTAALKDDMLSYLSQIVCSFDASFEQTYACYVKLNALSSASLADAPARVLAPSLAAFTVRPDFVTP